MAINTTESLLALIEKSKLFEPEQLSEAREAGKTAADARSLAKKLIAKELLTRWQAGQLLAGRAAFYLGKYRLVDLIGRGGMGSVFLARHIMMNRPVALKIISRHLCTDQANLDRFFSEARAVAALNHPNIVHAYSIDNEGDRYYMAMEFVEGQDLQRMVEKQGPLDFGEAADYVRQAADGLAHAHGKKIIHCDIKPANLLVNPQGVVKILDMGMARLVSPDEKNGKADEGVLGTVDYMSPELAVRSPETDLRADIYSLGCTLYFLLTGRPPFPEGTLPERIVKHQTAEPERIEKIRPEVPGDLVAICRKMMAKKPVDRYQTCEEIAKLLAGWQPPAQKSKPTGAAKVEDDVEEESGDHPLSIRDEAEEELESASTPKRTPKARSRPSLAALGKLPGVSKIAAMDKRKKIMLGAAAGLLLLLAVGAVGFLLMPSGSEPTKQELAAAPVKEEASGVFEEKSETPDLKVSDVAASSAEDVLNSLGDLTAPSTKPAAASPPPKQSETKPAEVKPQAKPAEAKPAETKPAVPKPAETKPAETKPAEKPAESKPKETKPVEAKAAETKPAEEKPPAAPMKEDPLRDLPPSIDLPLMGEKDNAKEPFEVGTIHSAAGEEWQLYLLGGEEAMKKSRKYLLERQEADPAKASWTIKLQTSVTGSDPQTTDVAKLWRADKALMFQWADGVAAGEANYLRNCMLQIRVQGASKYLPLLNPLAVEPLSIDIERGTAKAGFPIKWLPEGDALKVEITKVEGPENYRIEPKEPSPPKTLLSLVVVRTDRANNDTPGAKFQIVFRTRSGGINADVKLLEPPTNILRTIAADLRQSGADGARNQIVEQQGKIEKEMSAAKGGLRDQLDAQLRQLDMRLWYLNFVAGMQAGAKVHFRIFLQVQDKQVVLVSTDSGQGAPKAETAAAK
ncbi:MAG: protein kinase [Pirellulales bacterium]|nr:protein kinase [Pirellulales bacterium]